MKMRVNVEEIREKKLIDARLLGSLQGVTEVFQIPAKKLLTKNRFDVAIKLAYLKYREWSPEFATRCYDKHIRAFGLGNYVEPNQPHKDCLEAFLLDFERTARSIQHDGFDERISVIPLARDGSILNGSHRVASAIAAGKNVTCIKLDVTPSTYDYKFFVQRGVDQSIALAALEAVATYVPTVRAALIWPREAVLTTAHASELTNAAYFSESISVSLKELAACIRQVYAGSEWLGNPKNGYKGSFEKASNCYVEGQDLRLVIFDSEDFSNISNLKERIRALGGSGKHVLHISDGIEDSKAAWRSLLNINFRLATAIERFDYGVRRDERVCDIHSALRDLQISSDECCIVSGSVMEVLGLRDARDVDVISRRQPTKSGDLLDFSEGKNSYLHHSPDQIICDPTYHFHYNGIKYLAPEELRKFYANRYGEAGDVKDRMSSALIPVLDKSSGFWQGVGAKIFFAKLKAVRSLKSVVRSSLKKAGLLEFAKKMIRAAR